MQRIVVAALTVPALAIWWQHMEAFKRATTSTAVQQRVFGITATVPVSCIAVGMAAIFPSLLTACLLLLECYEAVVVTDFYELIIDYLGGATSSSRLLKVQSPLRLGRRLTIHPDEGTMLAIRRCVYQFYFAKPLLSMLAFVLEELHLITHPSIAPSFHVVTFSIVALRIVSVMMCMMAILVLYKLAAPLLRPFNVVGKFALIKVVVFANVIQMGLLIRTCFDVDRDGAPIRRPDFVEMPNLTAMALYLAASAIAFRRTFSAADSDTGKSDQTPTDSIGDV